MPELTADRSLRIAWIEPGRFPHGSDDHNIYTGILFPRAGPKMAGLLHSLGYRVEVISGETSPIEVDEIAGSFDLVCISVLSSTAPHGLVLARRLVERGVPVVMGGYHFAHRDDSPGAMAATTEALSFAPYVIRGEGYDALPGLLRALDEQTGLEQVAGLSYVLPGGGLQHNRLGPLLSREAIAALPLQDWTAVRDRSKVHFLGLHGMQGCPRNCSWCAVWTRDGRQNRNTPPATLVDELAVSMRDTGLRHAFFSADNFPAIHTWAREVCDEILRRGVKVSWTCQAEVAAYQRTDVVDRMIDAGCTRWCLGLESVNEASLVDSHKRQNRELMEACIRELRRRGIHTHGMFIVGLPSDTPQTVRETVEWARQVGVETCQFLCLSDLPGSQDYEEHELWDRTFRPFRGAFEPLNWLFVNGHYARLGTPAMSLAEVQQASIDSMERFYTFGRAIGQFLSLHTGKLRECRRRGQGQLASLAQAWHHNAITGYLRLRGWKHIRRWRRMDLNRIYCELLRATPDAVDALCERLLECLPDSWIETLQRVHAERRPELVRVD